MHYNNLCLDIFFKSQEARVKPSSQYFPPKIPGSFLPALLCTPHIAVRVELKEDRLPFLSVKIKSGKGERLRRLGHGRRESGKLHGITSDLETPHFSQCD